MKKTTMQKLFSNIICMVLIVAMALGTIGCGNKTNDGQTNNSQIENSQTEAQTVQSTEANKPESDITSLGEGQTKFFFDVINAAGETTHFEISTDETTVGAALLNLSLIAGDDGDYGLYVKTVNGETLDYDKDGKYWAFYVDGEYASTGVDQTDIQEGSAYTFKAE